MENALSSSVVANWHPRNIYYWQEQDLLDWNAEYPYGYAYHSGHMWRPVITGMRGNVARIVFEIVK